MTEPSQHDCALILMCKRPKPGSGKQRVAAVLGEDIALSLAELLFECAMSDLSAWHGPTYICVADAEDAEWAQSQTSNAKILVQCEGNLGQRINDADSTVSQETARRLFIGIDAPTLTTDYLAACANALAQHDVVLGAADDGGVVVMGSAKPWPELDALPWSTDKLGAALASQCERSGYTVSWHDAHADIDNAAQFAAIADQLCGDPRPTRIALRDWLLANISAPARASSDVA